MIGGVDVTMMVLDDTIIGTFVETKQKHASFVRSMIC